MDESLKRIRKDRVSRLAKEIKSSKQEPLLPSPLPPYPVDANQLMINTQNYFHRQLMKQWQQDPFPDAYRAAPNPQFVSQAQYSYGH